MPSGGFRSCGLLFFLACFSSLIAAFLASDFFLARSFSMTCSGAWTTTYPAVSKPARPARPAICWNSRVRRIRCRLPSNFASPVNSTVRIGTLMPTPRVSVPQMTGQQPGLGELLDQAAVLRQHPRVVDADPAAQQLLRVLPKPGAEAEGADPLGDRVLLLGAPALAHDASSSAGGVLDRGRLREVHDVHRRLAWS